MRSSLPRTVFSSALIIALAITCLPTRGSAAITLQQSAATLPQGSLVQYTVRAIGTSGEIMNVFSSLSIAPASVNDAGAHQVWTLPPPAIAMTPTKQQHNGSAGIFNADWEAYDTYFLFQDSQVVFYFGSPFAESNDESSTGLLGLSTVAGTSPKSGFGAFSSGANAGGAALSNSAAGSNLAFLQVVLRAGDRAFLNVRIDGDAGRSQATFINYLIGSVPEPNSSYIAGLGTAAAFGWRRRRVA